MSLKTIRFLAEQTGIPAPTWRKAVNRQPRPFSAVQQGKTWLIDDETPEVQAYIKQQTQTKAKGRGRRAKPKIEWWLIEETDVKTLGFTTKEEAVWWARHLTVRSKIYQAADKSQAYQQHSRFLIRQTKGLEFWDSYDTK